MYFTKFVFEIAFYLFLIIYFLRAILSDFNTLLYRRTSKYIYYNTSQLFYGYLSSVNYPTDYFLSTLDFFLLLVRRSNVRVTTKDVINLFRIHVCMCVCILQYYAIVLAMVNSTIRCMR